MCWSELIRFSLLTSKSCSVPREYPPMTIWKASYPSFFSGLYAVLRVLGRSKVVMSLNRNSKNDGNRSLVSWWCWDFSLGLFKGILTCVVSKKLRPAGVCVIHVSAEDVVETLNKITGFVAESTHVQAACRTRSQTGAELVPFELRCTSRVFKSMDRKKTWFCCHIQPVTETSGTWTMTRQWVPFDSAGIGLSVSSVGGAIGNMERGGITAM